MKNKSLIIMFLLPFLVSGQTVTDDMPLQKAPEYIQDGAFSKDHNLDKEASFEYAEINEKDIVWSRTIWREIDLRQKMNHHFYFPAIKDRQFLDSEKMSLIDVVMESLQQNARNQLNNAGGGASVMSNSTVNRLDCFNTAPKYIVPGKEFDWGLKTPQQILTIGQEPASKTPKYKDDGSGDIEFYENGDTVFLETETDPWDRTSITKWLVKEEWFFDKKRSVMDVRIIGLAPVAENFTVYTKGGSATEVEDHPVFWIYYPDFRNVLLNTKVANFTKNNAQERSFLGVFEKRMFVSQIIMESNIMNRSITDYMIGLDALLESERIKEEIFNIEHDMWEY
jgi:gliding motility associated protien GldN